MVKYWLIYPYPPGLLHWHCGNLTIAPVPVKHPWWKWVNASCEFIMNDYITTTKQSTTKSCANFLGYTVCVYIYTTSLGQGCWGIHLWNLADARAAKQQYIHGTESGKPYCNIESLYSTVNIFRNYPWLITLFPHSWEWGMGCVWWVQGVRYMCCLCM